MSGRAPSTNALIEQFRLEMERQATLGVGDDHPLVIVTRPTQDENAPCGPQAGLAAQRVQAQRFTKSAGPLI